MAEKLTVQGEWFVDPAGRRRLLRGVNLGGSSKLPADPDGATHLPIDFDRYREVSFSGRPFPLAEADEHFTRLRRWGFDCLRLVTTWEAIEHAGPGEYDEAYLDYLAEITLRAGDYGFAVIVDGHQDVWSRFTGGSGAPGWTLELAGFHLACLDESEAAICMAPRLAEYDSMLWHLNGGRLASATMLTLFFAGRRFAPHLTIAGENIQDYLQRHYIHALARLAGRLSGMAHVLGYDPFNEPQPGYIGLDDLSATQLMWANGPLLTPFEGMFVPAGVAQRVPWIQFSGFQPSETRQVTLNPGQVSAWLDPQRDVWQAHGVWDFGPDGRPRLLRPDFFAGISFFRDCVRPFLEQAIAQIRTVHPGAVLFVEGQPGSLEPPAVAAPGPLVNAAHWYDVLTLHTKHYDPQHSLEFGTFQFIQGEQEVRQMFSRQIGLIKSVSGDALGGAPTLIGEFGVPYDLDDGAGLRSGDFSLQEAALDAYYAALDAHLVHAAIWNYTSDNTNRWGDGWNREDLSIYSPDQRADPAGPDSGARALAGFCRPRLLAAAGTPLAMRFYATRGLFELVIEADEQVSAPTEVYLPAVHFPDGPFLQTSAGEVEYNREEQRAVWRHPGSGRQQLVATRSKLSLDQIDELRASAPPL